MVSFTDPLVHVVSLSISALITTVLAVYGERRWHIQGARPFVGLMASFALVSSFHLFGLVTHDPWVRVLLNDIRWTGTALLPFFWLWFAFEYTGQDKLTSRRGLQTLSTIPILTIILVWTNNWHGLMWTTNEFVNVNGLAIMDQAFGPWFWIWTAFTYAAGCIGAFLLFRLVWVSDHLFADQSILLSIGVAVAIAASVMGMFELVPNTDPPLDLAPYSFAITGVAFGYALFRHHLFDLVPAARQLGRNTAIRQLDDGLLILDNIQRVIYLNPAAASVLGYDRKAVIGSPIGQVVIDIPLEFDTTGDLAEIDRDGRIFEIRSSPITDRQGRRVGYTLLLHDITERKRRERKLISQRDELERINELNAVIRGVNQALVSTSTQEEILDAVCTKLAESNLYQIAAAADLSTWRGKADRWISRGAKQQFDSDQLPMLDSTDSDESNVVTTTDDDSEDGSWTIIPILYERTLHGGITVCTDRRSISDRERYVLEELGALIGHAINAVENRQLLSAETVIEVVLETNDSTDVLAAVTAEIGCRMELAGIVSASDESSVAFFDVEGPATKNVQQALENSTGGNTRVIGEQNSLLEWKTAPDDLLSKLKTDGTRINKVVAKEGTVRYTFTVSSEARLRSLLERVRESFPQTRLVARQELDQPIDFPEPKFDTSTENLTDRQQDALEAAYRAGYFEWPRLSTAEEVAETLDISAPTLHAHLRKAEQAVIDELFQEDDLD